MSNFVSCTADPGVYPGSIIENFMQKLNELFDCVWDFIESVEATAKRPEGPWTKNPAGSLKSESSPEKFAVLQYLERSLAEMKKWGLEEIVTKLAPATDLLAWSQNPSYKRDILGAHFMMNYATGLLTGPDAPFAQKLPPSGFLLLGKYTEYPAHSHAPREIYLVLTPGEWCLDQKEWFPVSPGEIIYHAPNQIHAMRTQSLPMLAFGVWLDDGKRDTISI
jgi:hypothetical protein